MSIELKLDLKNIDQFSDRIVPLVDDYLIIGLTGELGSGKTTLMRSFSRRLGIEEEVTSPTYSIENEYLSPDHKIMLRHVDLYRGISFEQELEILERRHSKAKEVLAIEWFNLLKNRPPENVLEIYFRVTEGDPSDRRTVTISGDIDLLSRFDQQNSKKLL